MNLLFRALLVVLPLFAPAVAGANTVENLSSYPLTSALADLGEARDWGLPPGISEAVLEGPAGVSWAVEVREGRLLGTISLPAGASAVVKAAAGVAERLDVSVGEDGRSASMTNGLLRWTCAPAAHGAPRWQLSLGSSSIPQNPEILLEHMRYRSFIDSEPRGRLKREEYVEFGAIDVELLPVSEIKTSRSETAVTVQVFRSSPEKFPGLDFMEEYTLRAGFPLLEYRMRPANNGSVPLYLAYVYWEGDLHGRYGPGLTGTKLLAAPYWSQPLRLVSSDSGGEGTLTRWGRGWGTERAWVGLQTVGSFGLGLGVTTPKPLTDKHYYGSSIWVASEWQVHFDLTETVRGHYPVELETGGKRAELGLDLVISQGAVEPGPVARQWLLQADKPGRAGTLIDGLTGNLPVAVTAEGGRAIRPVAAMAAVTELAGGQMWKTARLPGHASGFILGDERVTEATASIAPLTAPRRLSAEIAMDDGAASVRFTAISGTREEVLGEAAAGGSFERVLDPASLTLLQEPWQLSITTAGRGGAAHIKGLAFGVPRPAAPELQSPLPDQSVTDVAAFFRWVSVPRATAYDLEYGLADQSAPPRRETIDFLGDLPHFMPVELPAPGQYSWRVRALLPDGTAGPWSDSLRFTINDEHTVADVIRPIGPENPLFAMEVHGATSLVPFTDAVPADLRPYTAVLSWHTQYFKQIKKPLLEFFSEPAKHGEPISLIVRFGHGGMAEFYVSLSELEAIFQQCPWVIGVIGTESFASIYGSDPYVRRLIQLCGKYGRWFIEGDGNYSNNKLHRLASDAETADLVRRYAPYVVFSQKNNIHYLQHVNQSSLMGMKLSGMIGQMGSWEDAGWYWEQVGFRGLGEWKGIRSGNIAQMPAVFWALTWVHGLSQGATVFHVDGQVSTGKPSGNDNPQATDFDFKAIKHQVWDTEGETYKAYHNVVVPIFRAIVNERLIPAEATVIDGLPLAVREDQPWKQESYEDGAFYAQYTPLYQETYGFFDETGSEAYEYFPNTGRFGYFPILPLGAPPLKKSDGTLVPEVPMSSLTSREAVREVFHKAYPEVDYGDALVMRHPGRFFVQNSHENKDLAQRARIPVDAEGVAWVEAVIEPHMYLIGRWNRPEGGLWLQTNCEYADRTLRLTVVCEREPAVTVTPASALKRQTWRDGLLELELTSKDGAADIEITAKP